MRNARHQLILLGLLCQGLTWDDYVMPAMYLAAWLLCLLLPRRPMRLGDTVESIVLAAGIVLAFFAGRFLGYSNHFALGHGLALIQLLRLLRPLDHREKMFSLLIAFFHLAVACTFLFDYRFLLVLFGAAMLLPKALAEVESSAFLLEAEAFPGPKSWARPRITAADYLVITGMAVAFFMLFPRGFLVGGLRLPTTRPGESGTLLDSVMDPTSGARANSQRILFQVQGERVGYLRCYPLAEFDGQRWTQGDDYRWRNLSSAALDDRAEGTLHRRVRVKNPAFLGRVVPVDGEVLAVRGSFFRIPYQTRQGMVGADYMAAGPINVYDYWIASNAVPARLRAGEIRQLTNHPALSPRLKTWLDQVLAGRTNQYEQARFLEQYLATTFTYQLGAPDLNRLNPTEDFLLNQKTGHCERFASALAVLLRERGIPSRVLIGYLPRRSRLSPGWYDVRLRDAHAWTEAWFPGRGWVNFDATPAASLPPPTAWSDWLEALDFAWYAHVVNYDAPAQNALLRESAQQVRDAAYWAWANQLLLWSILIPVLLYALWRKRRARAPAGNPASEAQRQAQIVAGHCYGKMLHALARQGHQRAPGQTPLEFLQSLQPLGLPAHAQIEAITQAFCATRYGLRPLSAAEQRQLEAALQAVEEAPTAKP